MMIDNSFMDTPTLLVALATLGVLLVTSVPFVINFVQKTISVIRLKLLLWKLNSNKDSDDHPDIEVSELYNYPVKSMKAVTLEKVAIDNKGFVNDRRYMVVYELPLPIYKTEWTSKDTRYRFLTQRQCPSLATITAQLDCESNNKNETSTSTNHDTLVLKTSSTSAPTNNTTIRIPVSSNGPKQMYLAGIWDDTVLVEDMGDEPAQFIQNIVDHDSECVILAKVRLVRHTINDRAADKSFVPSYAKTWWGTSPLVSLTDGYPILIASQASLDQLNEKLQLAKKDTIPMNRFRPNIVIKGSDLKPFVEDTWKIIVIGDVMFAIVKGCPRCKQSCTDQTTGQVTNEPLETMKTFRNFHNDDVFFAQNAIPLLGVGQSNNTIKVGDKIRVLQRGDPIFM